MPTESHPTGEKLTPIAKVYAIYDGGICRTLSEAYWFLVDSGDIAEDTALYNRIASGMGNGGR